MPDPEEEDMDEPVNEDEELLDEDVDVVNKVTAF